MLHDYLNELDEARTSYRVRVVCQGFERTMKVVAHDETTLRCESSYPGSAAVFVNVALAQTIDVLVDAKK